MLRSRSEILTQRNRFNLDWLLQLRYKSQHYPLLDDLQHRCRTAEEVGDQENSGLHLAGEMKDCNKIWALDDACVVCYAPCCRPLVHFISLLTRTNAQSSVSQFNNLISVPASELRVTVASWILSQQSVVEVRLQPGWGASSWHIHTCRQFKVPNGPHLPLYTSHLGHTSVCKHSFFKQIFTSSSS